MSSPAINATVHAVVRARLGAGTAAAVVRQAVVREFVEAFAADAPDKLFVKEYEKQITDAVDEAIRIVQQQQGG